MMLGHVMYMYASRDVEWGSEDMYSDSYGGLRSDAGRNEPRAYHRHRGSARRTKLPRTFGQNECGRNDLFICVYACLLGRGFHALEGSVPHGLNPELCFMAVAARRTSQQAHQQ